MFQSFEEKTDPANGPKRLALLRTELLRHGYDGFLIPRADAHQGEYVAACDERLAWLTGFTGSAGMAATLGDKAAIFVDGRYTLQAQAQVDGDAFDHLHLVDHGLSKWLEANLGTGQLLAFDPWLHTLRERRALEKICARAGADLVAVEENPLDAVWHDRPSAPMAPVEIHPLELAGRTPQKKLDDVRAALTRLAADACVLTEPDAVAWMFNIRGGDLAHLPVARAFAILNAEGKADLFIDDAKLSEETRAHLAPHTNLHAPDAFAARLHTLGVEGHPVLLDPARAASAVAHIVTAAGGTLVEAPDPTERLKAVKTRAEQDGARAAHERDGLAMCRFLAWLDRTSLSGSMDEITAASRLEAFRAESGELRDLSFDTISGFGPNGAIVHYRVTTKTNRAFAPGSIYLVDSGAQYRDGTTDITRAIAVGDPDDDMRRTYTLVLKGHIAVARVTFPKGTSGAQLDTLARYHLWQAGLDYDHGTGHGIGSYLSVHEGPQRISKLGSVVLEPGMIISNEPGYYRTGAFGIRLENLVLVQEAPTPAGGEKTMLGFETLSYTPFDRRLIDVSLLTSDERDWLNAYHATTRDMFTDDLDANDRAWLEEMTAEV